jgi:hypothetical protein
LPIVTSAYLQPTSEVACEGSHQLQIPAGFKDRRL